MIDVNKITSTLAKLPDQQLQQYAQMHKSDPYIMALAMSESNRRKEMRAAGQGGQGMQEQPKVVDSEIAQMAPQQMPEDMGIGQLPAGEMNFAGGGIIAFADGGDVERYQSGGLFETDPQKLRAMAEKRLRLEQLRQGRLIPGGPYSSLPSAAQSSGSMFRGVNPAGLAGYGFGLYHGDLNEGEAAELERRRALGPTLDAQTQTATFSPEESRAMLNRAEQPARVNPAVYGAPAPAAPTADTTRKVPVAGPVAGPQPTSANKEPAGLDSIMAEFTRKQELAQGAAKNADVQYASSLRGEAKKLVADEEKRIKDQIDPYKDREARLLKQEKGFEGMGDKYLGLALLQAGAAMMTTPGGVGVALGKGVQVGSERYIAGIDKINAAKDKFAEARDRLDDLRLNRSDMNARDIKAAKTEARTLERQAEALFYTGAREDLKMTDKNLTTLLGLAADDLKTTRQIDAERANTLTREGGADRRAARNPQLELLQAVNKDPKLAAAYQAMHGKGEDVMGQYNDFLKANPILAQDPQQAVTQFLMTKSVFSQLGKTAVTDKPSTKVRTQP